MKMPDSMPPLLEIQAGLPLELQKEQVIFEKYIQTRMMNAEGNRLYANGDFYKIYLNSNQSLKEDNISWKKIGVISQSGIERIRKISDSYVVDYLNDGPHEVVNMAVENVNWYFYFDEPKFVESQVRQWKWWTTPKFVNKMNKTINRNLTQ